MTDYDETGRAIARMRRLAWVYSGLFFILGLLMVALAFITHPLWAAILTACCGGITLTVTWDTLMFTRLRPGRLPRRAVDDADRSSK